MQSIINDALREAFSHDEETFTCPCCNEEYTIAEEHFCIGDEEICESCYDAHAVICAGCREIIWSDDNAGDENTPLCNHCFEYRYTNCERCGCLISNEDACYDADGDYPYCESCYQQFNIDSIHDYNYKPDAIFYGNSGLYMGVELEIDRGGKNSDNASSILKTANENNEYLYIKTDGSLDNGLELVTHPCSLEYHMHYLPWEQIVSKSLNLGYLSHKTSTCGLHVHVNRNAYYNNYENQEEWIGKILFFIEKHWEELLKFSRRTQTQLNQWAARYGFKNDPKDILHHAKNEGSGRYTCLNLDNYDTIEFRIFRGTLKFNTLIATLQLIDKICNVAFSMSDKELCDLSWTSFVEQIDAPELITYLKERRLYINEPVECEEEY